MLQSYAELVKRLLPGTGSIAFCRLDGLSQWTSSDLDRLKLESLVQRCLQDKEPVAMARMVASNCLMIALPLRHDEKLVGALAISVAVASGDDPGNKLIVAKLALQPVLTVVAHEMRPIAKPARNAVLTERTEELEWLFAVTADMRPGSSESAAIEQLLAAAVERMEASFGGLSIPAKRVGVTYSSRARHDADSAVSYQQTHPHLMSFVQSRAKPLVINTPPPGRVDLALSKILAIPILEASGKVSGFLAFFRSRSSPDFGRRQIYLGRHIARQVSAMQDSQYDLPTGLFTRSALEKQVNQALEARPMPDTHSLIYIDIDQLHVVNETLGFETGDEVIVRIADLLHPPYLPSDAIASRIAGDRFVVFMPGHDTAQAQDRATQVQKEASKITAGPGQQRIALSLSCGISRLTASSQPFSRALATAELACKTAKDRGRNRSEVYLDVDESMIRRRTDISGLGRLRDALDNNHLCVYAQKIVPIADRTRASGVECLVRMKHEDGTILSPAAFMSAAQRYQMLKQIDEWVIRNTLETLKPHASLLFHNGMYVSINISGQSLNDAAFVHQVESWVRDSTVAPGLITFEITETAAVSNLPRADELMRGLRRLGCRFALDDFGTGVNSLTYLKSLQVDRVKIDGSFVRDLVTNPRSTAMVRAVVQLAQSLEIDCVAEFVENEAIMRRVRELGVTYAQGYFVHKPEPLEDVLNALANEESRRVKKLILDF